MGKQVTIYSQYKAPQGFWKKDNTKVWIQPGKHPLEEDVYNELLVHCAAFKSEVDASNIMVHTAKQEKKADDQVSKLEKEKAEMQKKIDNLQGQVNHFANKPKTGAKTGPKPKA